jgi:hypothetical protein
VADDLDTGVAPKSKGSLFTKKWHGVPVSVLFAGGGVALYFGYRWYKNRQSSSSTTTPSTTSTGDTTGTGTDTSGLGSGGGGWGGGSGGGSDSGLASDISALTTAITGLTTTGVLSTLTPQPVPPGTTGVPYSVTVPTGDVVPSLSGSGGTDQAAVTALQNAESALAKAKASGNKTAIANATKNLSGAQAAVNARNTAYEQAVAAIPSGFEVPAPIPSATKTTPTGVAAQQAPSAAQAATLANLQGELKKDSAGSTAGDKASVATLNKQIAAVKARS